MYKIIIGTFVLLLLAGSVYGLTVQQEFDLKVFGRTAFSEEELNKVIFDSAIVRSLQFSLVRMYNQMTMYKDLYEANKKDTTGLMTFNEWSRRSSQGGQCSNTIVEVPVETKECWQDGDVDCSGTCDASDYIAVKGNMGRTDCTGSNDWCDNTDFDRDGNCNTEDLGVFQECMNG